jgi:NADH-quinone oxidoreductase subunit M
VVFGELVHDGVRELKDINGREFLILATLAVFVLLLGIWPAPLVEVMHASVANLVEHVAVSKL